jgi:hypothetical protein
VPRFALRFCVSARRFDERGFLFGKQITAMSPRQRTTSLAGPLAEASGGYVFVFDGRVWNTLAPAAFDPVHVHWDMDSFAYAALMINLEITRVESGKLALTGRDHDGKILYPTRTVSSRVFVRELLAATDDFLRIAHAEVRRRRARTAQQDRALLERFRRAAETIHNAGPSAL